MAGAVMGEDYPFVCESCLGPNPYVRMIKTENGTECKISKRPCTKFEWRNNGVKKETCVAYAVAAQKNICQVCMTDMVFGLPVNVRDAFLRQAQEKGYEGVAEGFGSLPQSRVGKDFLLDRQQHQLAITDGGSQHLEAQTSLINGAIGHSQSNQLGKFSLPDICPEWVLNGKCMIKTGNCPKRPCCGAKRFPELPKALAERLETDLKNKPIEQVQIEENALKLLRGLIDVGDSNKPSTEIGSHTRTIFVSNLSELTTESQLEAVFSKFPGVDRIKLVSKPGHTRPVAFIEFKTKSDAEFVLSLNGLVVGESSCVLSWAKPNNTEKSNSRKSTQSTENRVKKIRTEDETPEIKSSSNEPVKVEKSKDKIPLALLEALKKRKEKGLE